MLKYNGSILRLPSKSILDYVAPPTLLYPSDMDFIYLANTDTEDAQIKDYMMSQGV